MSVNKVILVGRLGQDPELKYTASGTPVANFSLATNEYWSDKNGQRQEKTEWHRIVVWAKQAELCQQYLGKGRQVYLEGSLQTNTWEDQNGQKRYTTEVVARTVRFLGGSTNASMGQEESPPSFATQNNQNNNGGHQQQNGSAMNQEYDVSAKANFTEDDIPF